MSSSNPVRKFKSALGNALRVLPRGRMIDQRGEVAEPRFRVGLERPLPYETVGDRIEIRGWAVSFDQCPVYGEIVVNDRVRVPISLSEHRIDVVRSFGLDARDASVGFCHQVAWSEIGEDLSRAELRLEFFHEEEVVVLGPLPVSRIGHDAEQKFAFRLERPANNEVVSGDIAVSGWAVSLDGQPVSGRVRINHQEYTRLEFSQIRPDVSRVYDLPQCARPVGFEHSFSWQHFGDDVSNLSLDVELIHGQDLIVMGPYTITRTDAPVLRHQRGSYKEVWNGAASDRVSAMACVAGTSEEQAFDESGVSTGRTIQEALDITASDVVLEIGCGVGRVGRNLAPVCSKWIGVDISEGMISFARENLAAFSNVELMALSSCSLSEIEDESVNKLYCSTVFMHLDEWDRYRYVQEAFRVLLPGGRCYFDNVNLNGEIGWAVFEEIMAIDPAQRCAAVSKPSTGEELRTYLEMAGFIDVSLRAEPLYITAMGVKPS